MIYDYLCSGCGTGIEVSYNAGCGEPYVICSGCGGVAPRDYGSIQMGKVSHGYSKALGIDLDNKSSKDRFLKEYEEKTGSKLVEVGNEDIKRAETLKKTKEYNYGTIKGIIGYK